MFRIVFAAFCLLLVMYPAYSQGFPNGMSREKFRAAEISELRDSLQLVRDKERTGVIVTGPDGKPGIELTEPGKLIQIPIVKDRDEKIPRGINGLPLRVRLHTEDDKIVVDEVRLPMIAEWEKKKISLPKSKFHDLHDVLARLEKDFSELIKPGAMGNDKKTQEDIQEAQRIIRAYSQSPNVKDIQQSLLCQTYSQLRELDRTLTREFGKKAVHGSDDNYRPQVYERILANAKPVVAIASPRGNVVGSGTLIGKNIVLTCTHVFEKNNLEPTHCTARFDYEDRDGNSLAHSAFPITKVATFGKSIPGFTSRKLDFTLVEIGTENGDQVAVERPVQLSLMHPDRDTSIYVIGHPRGGGKEIHDNAFVLFPFQLIRDDLTHLQLIACAEYLQARERGDISRDRDKRIYDDFIKSYKPTNLENAFGEKIFRLFSNRWELPILMADCDTSEGDSGGPCFDREHGRMIGILHGGVTNPDHVARSGWRRHEAIIPLAVIVEQIDKAMPGWREKYAVRFAP